MVSCIQSCDMSTLRAKTHVVPPHMWCFLLPGSSALALVTAATVLSGPFSARPFWNHSWSSRNFLLLFFAFLSGRSDPPFAWLLWELRSLLFWSTARAQPGQLLLPLQRAAATFLFSSFYPRRCFPPSSPPSLALVGPSLSFLRKVSLNSSEFECSLLSPTKSPLFPPLSPSTNRFQQW